MIDDRLLSAGRSAYKSAALYLGLFCIVFLFMLFCFPFEHHRFEFDPDEGINCIKAFLISRGHPLYEEIRSDQPPVFTYLLVGVFSLFGPSVESARTLTLFFSSSLIVAAIAFLRGIGEGRYALIGVILLLLVPNYIPLSMAVMIGLPALSLAMVSLAVLVSWHRQQNPAMLIASACCMALSVMVKAIAFFLVPLIILGLVLEGQRKKFPAGHGLDRLKPVLSWSASFFAVSGFILIFGIGLEHLGQIWQPYFNARHIPFFNENLTFISYLGNGLPLYFLFLGAVGSIVVCIRKNIMALYLVSWFLLAIIFLHFHFPVWRHHLLLVTVPAALLGAIAMAEFCRVLRELIRGGFQPVKVVLAGVIISLFGWVLVNRSPNALSHMQLPSPPFMEKYVKGKSENRILSIMRQYASQTRWIVTDRPMYAFREKIEVPPELAVLSKKRLMTKEVTEADVIDVIKKRQPELVLLERFSWPKLGKALADGYVKVLKDGKTRLYVSKKLVQAAENP